MSASLVLQGGAVPYQKSSVNYTMEARDADMLAFLRGFYHRRGAPTAVVADKYLVRIANMRPDSFVDLVCQACSPHCSITAQK